MQGNRAILVAAGSSRAESNVVRAATGKGPLREALYENNVDANLLASTAFIHANEGIMIVNANNIVVDINSSVTLITGYAREEIVGRAPRFLGSKEQGPEFYARMWQSLLDHDFWFGEIRSRRKTGEAYRAMLAISVVRDVLGRLQHYIGVFSGVHPTKLFWPEIDPPTQFDGLTGLPTRLLFSASLDYAIADVRRNNQPLAVCCLDLDGFETINDLGGYAVGNQLLVEIGRRLKAILRADDSVARLGGDEFGLLFACLARVDDIHPLLERVLEVVKAPALIGGHLLSVTASIGVSLYPADEVGADMLLRHADQAMYRAKEWGRNRYFLFDPNQGQQARAQSDHLEALRRALDKDELVLHYQPKVDLVSGEVTGVEALIRWQHPEKGVLLPGAFLHSFEGSDLEFAIGEWVIEAALRQVSAWMAVGIHLPVSVNIGASHLLRDDFFERLGAILKIYPDVAPSDLVLEILETAAFADIRQAVRVLNDCRSLGVLFALDDFGTGYSSLRYLRTLPADVLKIDQSFVRDMLEDADDFSIVESIVGLALAFDRQVIAEGVETLEHGAMLVQLRCRVAQGYGIARPMPAMNLPDWIQRWQSDAAWRSFDTWPQAREDLILKVLARGYRIWIEKVTKSLSDISEEGPIPFEVKDCRLGRWLKSSGETRYGTFPEFRAFVSSYERLQCVCRDVPLLTRNLPGEVTEEWQVASIGALAKLEELVVMVAYTKAP